MPYMTTEQWTKWAEEQEVELAERRAAQGRRQAMPPWPAPAAGSLLGSPEHDHAKGGRLPLGFRRTWAQPAPGQRPLAAGIEIDPEGAVIVREIFLLVRAGRTLKEISEALSRQYGRHLGISRLHAILHHPLIRWPPSPELRIVEAELHREALLALRERRGRWRELHLERARESRPIELDSDITVARA